MSVPATVRRDRWLSITEPGLQSRSQRNTPTVGGGIPIMMKISKYLLHLVDLLQKNLPGITAGALHGSLLKGEGEIGLAQRFQRAPAAADLAEVQIILPSGILVLGVLLLELHRAHRR